MLNIQFKLSINALEKNNNWVENEGLKKISKKKNFFVKFRNKNGKVTLWNDFHYGMSFVTELFTIKNNLKKFKKMFFLQKWNFPYQI